MRRVNLLGNTVSDLEQLMLDLGEEKYKGRQLFKWLYNTQQYDFKQMSNLTLNLRQRLAENYIFRELSIKDISQSKDGTEKFLFQLEDKSLIESVLIPEGAKRTVCISSQVGCSLGCKFCATGQLGFKRNLTVGEIIGQLLFLKQHYDHDAFRNIVFMGMGEPLLNYGNMVQAIEIIKSGIGLSLAAKRVTVSTAGIVPAIYTLADSELKVNLAVSLNSANNKKRGNLMPVARKFNLKKLAESIRYYTRKSKKRVTFEYILFDGINDSREDALELAAFVHGIPCKINILTCNPVIGLPYRRSSEGRVNEFAQILYPRTPAVTIRKSRGIDIEAACGQLAGKYIKYKKKE